ncbi:AI-2E family transporter [Leptospira sp. GIMC2001]|uniref:AI-2E family transporter n=1 Tax=Leptospira sp. GIMC2001 TaxID=1513297 RepID=UPI00234AF311|nr:AI-2E family transporter [Leptospira sp. GIMC2001]WCL49236.1 AI-2E family transporter [Leptospira sp. GIMC2001]
MKKEPNELFKYETYSFILLLIAIIFLIVYMIWDFFTPLIFAGIVGGTFYPLLNFILRKTKFSRTIASLIVCSIIIVILFIPTVYVVVRLSKEILNFYQSTRELVTEENLNMIFFGNHSFAILVNRVFDFLNLDYSLKAIENLILSVVKSASGFFFEKLNAIVGNFFSFLFQFILMLLGIFVILQEGPRIKEFMLNLSPIRNEDEELIIQQFNRMNYVTLVFNGIGGLIQGLLAAIGFWIVGIQSLLLWTVLMIILAFIPLLGISIIYVPATIYLLIVGKIWQAVFLFVYCTLIALITENWFKPAFVGKHIEMNSYLVFFSIITGMSVFGMAGIFYGPLVASLFLTLARLYIIKYERYFRKTE